MHSDFLLFALLSLPYPSGLNHCDIHKQFALYFLFTKKKKKINQVTIFLLPLLPYNVKLLFKRL